MRLSCTPSRILPRALLVAGMAFFWPLVRGPFFAAFFGPAADVPDAVPYVFNVLALLLSVTLGLAGSRALEGLAGSRRAAVVVPGFLAVAAAASVALAVQALAGGAAARAVSMPLAAAAFAALACVWAAACCARACASSYVELSLDVMLSYLASFAVGLPCGFADALPAKVCLALFPAASALLWWALAVRTGLVEPRGARRSGMRSRTASRVDSQSSTRRDSQPQPQLQRQTGSQVTPQSQPGRATVSRPMLLLLAAVAVLEIASAVLSGAYSRVPVGGEALSLAFALPLVPCVLLATRRTGMRALVWGLALIPVAMGAMLVMAYSSPFIEAGLDALTMGRRAVWVLYFLLLVSAGVAADAGRGREDGAGLSVVRFAGCGFVPLYALTRLVLDTLRLAEVGETLSEDHLHMLTVAVALVLTACSFAIVGLVVAGRDAEGAQGAADAPGVAESSGALNRELRQRACAALADEYGLTDRETAVLELVSMGYTVQRIAEERGVTQNTVRTHTKGLYRKLDTHSKQEVIELVNRRMGCGEPAGGESAGGERR